MVVSSRGGALPTRKNRAAADGAKPSEVTKQQQKEGLTTVDDMESRQYSPSGRGASGGEARMGSASANDTTKQQSFVMDDIPTIDTSSMPPAYDRSNRGRGASPSIITSRRGRSRSPVGYTTPSAAASSSRPNSRNGSSGRPLSRNDISSAALAAGEAAAGVMDPYARQMHHPQLVHGRARSPSPVNRFPTSALSFELSPQQSLSFVGDGHSFDWTSGAREDHHHHQNYHYHQQHQRYGSPQHHRSRSSSPIRAASRNSQALFPEHQILSASRSREYFGTQGGRVSAGNGGSGNRERRTIRSPSPPKMAHRSSVFRGSPSPDNAANRLPAELMLALDDTPPSSPVISKPKKRRPSTSTIIDKELSATQDVAFENIQFDGIMPDGDYLANLSFRRSYELEQVFSFMNENKDDKNNKYDPMKLGTSSFANFANQLMCNSNEVDINNKNQITSQNSNMGDLTPINSFNDVQVDADELGRFLSSSVQEGQQDPAGQYWSNQSSAPPAGGMNTQTPPSYNNVHNEGGGMNNGPPSGPGPSIPSLENSLANTTQVKVSTRHTLHPMVNLSSRSDFFVLLRKMAPAFMGFRFTLPEMNEPAPEIKDGPVVGKWNRPTENQMMICRRRVNSSVCAFGGIITNRAVSFDTMSDDVKEELEEKRKYDENLSMRYYMKENCVSWDVELHEVVKPSAKKAKIEAPDTPKASALKSPYCAPVTPKSPGSPGGGGGDGSNKDEKKKTKTKYRCKLCGLPKQNHTCTYKQKVFRSIGTQVYPVVNAFVSNEPGLLAPALSEMNNFTSLLSQDTSTAPSHHPVYRAPYSAYNGPVTPESHWSPNTPGGLSTMSSSDPGTPGTPHSPYSSSHRNNFRKREFAVMSRTMTHASTPGGYSARSKPDDAMFRDTMEIKREQFRTVRTSVAEKVAQPYQYPLVPTPYDQRKEMGDTLFALSKEVPALADSCASILREAREKDEWDQAVAELTTQVLVVLKCEDDDYTLEGLMRHLNALGIAC